jgi:sugar porter (SP) family MFS transporter
MTKQQVATKRADMVSLFQAGSFFGAGIQLPFTEKYGRKWSVIFSNVIFIASAFAQTFANGSIVSRMSALAKIASAREQRQLTTSFSRPFLQPIFVFGRFLGGFAVGFLSLVIPVYLAEFSPPSIRGRLVGFFDIFIQVGTLCGFWINYAIETTLESNRFQWQLPVFVQFFPAALLLVGAFFVPESPRWLLMVDKREQAIKNLTRIRGIPEDHPYLAFELNEVTKGVEAERALRGDSGLLRIAKELFVIHNHRKRLLFGMALIFFKTFSGVQAVNYYSPKIFEQLGFVGAKNSLFATGIYGTVKFVCTLIFGFFVVDRVGRRIPLIAGSIGLSLCLFFLGGYVSPGFETRAIAMTSHI